MKNSSKQIVFVVILLLGMFSLNAQTETETETPKQLFKLQMAFGVNNPFEDGSTTGFYSKYANFPTVDLGVQYMFEKNWGVKLDFGYNRSNETNDSNPFILQYYRVNTQIVYDATNFLGFLPNRIELIGHVGPGLSYTKPLAPYSNNTETFLNVLVGGELHYRFSETISIYTDLSYVFSMAGSDKYDVNVDGFWFNDDLLNLTFGLSFTLN